MEERRCQTVHEAESGEDSGGGKENGLQLIGSGQESKKGGLKKGVANHIRAFQGKESRERGKPAVGETEEKDKIEESKERLAN